MSVDTVYLVPSVHLFNRFRPGSKSSLVSHSNGIYRLRDPGRWERIENAPAIDVDAADLRAAEASARGADFILSEFPATEREATRFILRSLLFHQFFRTAYALSAEVDALAEQHSDSRVVLMASPCFATVGDLVSTATKARFRFRPVRQTREFIQSMTPISFCLRALKAKPPATVSPVHAITLTVGGRDLEALAPVENELALRSIHHRSFSVRELERYVSLRSWLKACRTFFILSRRCRRLKKRNPSDPSERWALRFFSSLGRDWLSRHEALTDEFLDRLSPQTLSCTEDLLSPLIPLLDRSCRRRAIRFNWIQHGFLSDRPWRSLLSPPLDNLILQGESARTLLLNSKIPESRCHVVGSIYFDRVQKHLAIPKKEFEQELAIAERFRGKVILFASQWAHLHNPMGFRTANLRALFSVIHSNPELFLIIKKHPLERDSLCEQVLEEFPALTRVRIEQERDLCKLLRVSAAVVLQWSAAGHEALLMNVPIIVISMTGSIDRAHYVRDGVGRWARTEAELASLIGQAVEGTLRTPENEAVRTEYLRRELYSGDGLAGLRFANLVDRQVSERRAT